MPTQYVSKPQPTLVGYSSWAFERLVERKAQSAATVAAQIIDEWFDSSREVLETRWNVRFEDWERLRLQEAQIEAEVERRVEKEVQARLSKSRGPRKITG